MRENDEEFPYLKWSDVDWKIFDYVKNRLISEFVEDLKDYCCDCGKTLDFLIKKWEDRPKWKRMNVICANATYRIQAIWKELQLIKND